MIMISLGHQPLLYKARFWSSYPSTPTIRPCSTVTWASARADSVVNNWRTRKVKGCRSFGLDYRYWGFRSTAVLSYLNIYTSTYTYVYSICIRLPIRAENFCGRIASMIKSTTSHSRCRLDDGNAHSHICRPNAHRAGAFFQACICLAY